jgi:formate hydrogenlyase subunit 3/multisubunit Na+/H+ antiporter MnhD subunit
MRNPIIRNVATVLGIVGIAILLGFAAKYGNMLIEAILANGVQQVIMIFVTALVVAVILGAVEIFINKRNNRKKVQHRSDAD